MKTDWHIMMVAGCLICASMVCSGHVQNELGRFAAAKSQTEDRNGFNFATSSQTSWLSVREQLRSLLALRVTDQVQVGLDQFRVGPLKAEKREILAINSHLLPDGGEDLSSRGYGLGVRLKLD